MSKFEPIDVIAIITVLGGFILTAFHLDGTISNVLIMVTSFYFGSKIRIKSPSRK